MTEAGPLRPERASHSAPKDLAPPIFAADHIDDLAREAFTYVKEHGESVVATRGANREVRHMQLTLENPRARVSRTKVRGKPFSALGEFCWYMKGSDRLDDIKPYITAYKDEAETGILRGAYGPRLAPQINSTSATSVVEKLKSKSESRQVVVPIACIEDFTSGQKDVPCTLAMQFFVRNEKLETSVTMRSNDLVMGLTHDVFAFTLIQEYVAARLGLELGKYVHSIASAHIYETKWQVVNQYLDVGWTDNRKFMPPMPREEPEAGLAHLLEIEESLRAGTDPANMKYGTGYWADLARLIGCHFLIRAGRGAEALIQRDSLSPEFNDCFGIFIEERTHRKVG